MNNREQIQRMISDLQVYRWRVRNSPCMNRTEKEDALWWINKEIADLFEDLNALDLRKAG